MTKLKFSYYKSPRDGMTHLDVYVISEDGTALWAGHLCMPPDQWPAFGGLLLAGNKNSTACEVTIEQAFNFSEKKEAS